MDAFEMVRLLKVRRNAILHQLPQDALRELEAIDEKIRLIDDALRAKPARVPLTLRRELLRVYLRTQGPTTRAQILTDTGIPAGTLSALLADPEFESSAHGLWQLRDGT